MRFIVLISLSFFTLVSMAMPPMAPPAPAINPAAVHTMHHSANVTAPHANQTSATNYSNTTNKLGSAAQYYENSVDGLREYIDSIETSYPVEYEELNENVSLLEQQQFRANVVSWGSIATSVVLTVGAFTFLKAEESTKEAHLEQMGETPEGLPKWGFVYTKKKSKVTNYGLITASALILAGGIGISSWMRPGQKDIRRVINKHNRLIPDEPLTLGFNFDIEKNMPSFNLAYNF